MLKIFLRKRFVCGEMHRWTVAEGKPFYLPKWEKSYETSLEAGMAVRWLPHSPFGQSLYDRKTKVTVKGNDNILRYLVAECTKK